MADKTRGYVSSTFSDLEGYRAKVNKALRKAGYELVAMEDYPAFDERPLYKCLDDVASCDIYVGILAWRYGYIPEKDNPDKKSITHREYERAGDSKLPRLMFLLDPEADWKRDRMDVVAKEGKKGALIQRFRDEVQTRHGRAFFKSPDDLAAQVVWAITATLSERYRQPPDRKQTASAESRSWNWPKPWDFGPCFVSKRRDFVGREWLFQQVADCVTHDGSQALLIQADYGVGKSAFIAELVHRNPGRRIIAHHCCQYDTHDTLNPALFATGVAA